MDGAKLSELPEISALYAKRPVGSTGLSRAYVGVAASHAFLALSNN